MRIYRPFRRVLAAESARMEAAPPLVRLREQSDEPSSVRERYAPMSRLLAEDDVVFLTQQGLPEAAKNLRREHRSCYFGYVRRLTNEIRAARRLGTLAMASQEHWSFRTLLIRTLLAESSLLYLRWLGCRHALGITVAAREVTECLNVLVAAQRFQPATT